MHWCLAGLGLPLITPLLTCTIIGGFDRDWTLALMVLLTGAREKGAREKDVCEREGETVAVAQRRRAATQQLQQLFHIVTFGHTEHYY